MYRRQLILSLSLLGATWAGRARAWVLVTPDEVRLDRTSDVNKSG